MRKVMLGLVAISLSACGGSSGSPGQAGLNTAFGGLWVGTFTLAGAITGSATGQLAVSVSGDSMDVGFLCPDGTGTVTASGSGNSASWSGSLVCPPTSGASNCPAGVFTFSSMASTLSGTTLNVLAQSNLSGCPSGNGAFTLSFSGTH
jgi:hypothetical protein